MGWLDELAAALGIDPLGPDETSDLLDAAREVAHGIERKVTPLAAFLLGMATERRVAAGQGRDDALEGALGDLRAALPRG
jgi:hypothetical protein